MGSKASPSVYDCLAAAAPDEPMFHLLGRDRHAWALVQLWALVRRMDGEDEAKVGEAFQCSGDMARHVADLGKPTNTPGCRMLEAILSMVSAVTASSRTPGQTELQQFTAMLNHTSVGHGVRPEYDTDASNPGGTAVRVESDGKDGGFMVTEFAFDKGGNLAAVECYEGAEG